MPTVIRATSDLHLSQRSAEWVFAALEPLRADAEEHGGTTVLVGDILDQPSMVHMPTFNRLREVLQSFKGSVLVVAGNHDQYDGTRNALEALDGGNVTVISEPMVTRVGLVVPYLPPDRFWEAVEALKREATEAQMGCWWTHQGWRGSYLNNMRRDHDGLSCKRVTAKLVVSGHYHMPQNLGPIIYCGSPYETSFSEEGQRKGWLRWTAKTPRAFAADPGIPERVPFAIGAPVHHTVQWDLQGADPKRPKGLKRGDRVRIVVNGTRDEVKKRAQTLKKAGLEGAAIVAEVGGGVREVIDRNSNPQDAVVQYVDRVHGPDPLRIPPVALHLWADEVGLWESS